MRPKSFQSSEEQIIPEHRYQKNSTRRLQDSNLAPVKEEYEDEPNVVPEVLTSTHSYPLYSIIEESPSEEGLASSESGNANSPPPVHVSVVPSTFLPNKITKVSVKGRLWRFIRVMICFPIGCPDAEIGDGEHFQCGRKP